jgi:RNA polymerase sigma-70 factor (ECF subfamily)
MTVIAQETDTIPVEFPEDWTDEELLLEYRTTGDRKVFTELVHRYQRELYGYLHHYLGSADMAEDVFQQTFLQVHLKCGQFRPGGKVRPWLYSVATNQAIDFHRRNRRHRIVSLDRRIGDPSEKGTTLASTLAAKTDPADEAVATEQREKVRQAVRDLPERLKQTVMLVYFQGLKYGQAAQALDIPVGTVKSRLHTAIAKLNGALADVRGGQN